MDNYAKPAGLYVGVRVILPRRKGANRLPCLPDGTPCIDENEPGSRFVYEPLSPEQRIPVIVLKALVPAAEASAEGILNGVPARHLNDIVNSFIEWGDKHKLVFSRKSVKFYSIQD